jgi:hypothetical protein
VTYHRDDLLEGQQLVPAEVVTGTKTSWACIGAAEIASVGHEISDPGSARSNRSVAAVIGEEHCRGAGNRDWRSRAPVRIARDFKSVKAARTGVVDFDDALASGKRCSWILRRMGVSRRSPLHLLSRRRVRWQAVCSRPTWPTLGAVREVRGEIAPTFVWYSPGEASTLPPFGPVKKDQLVGHLRGPSLHRDQVGIQVESIGPQGQRRHHPMQRSASDERPSMSVKRGRHEKANIARKKKAIETAGLRRTVCQKSAFSSTSCREQGSSTDRVIHRVQVSRAMTSHSGQSVMTQVVPGRIRFNM